MVNWRKKLAGWVYPECVVSEAYYKQLYLQQGYNAHKKEVADSLKPIKKSPVQVLHEKVEQKRVEYLNSLLDMPKVFTKSDSNDVKPKRTYTKRKVK